MEGGKLAGIFKCSLQVALWILADYFNHFLCLEEWLQEQDHALIV